MGDLVVGSDGMPTPVLGVYPQGRKEVFRVTAQDGASTLACGEHLWTVRTASDRRRGTWRTVQTKDMVGHLRAFHAHRYELPLVAPVEVVEREVPMHPYALGLLLGDGCLTTSTTPAYSTADPELVDSLQQMLGSLGIAVTSKSGYDYVLRHAAGGRGGLRVANPVTDGPA